ncbi:hypothetical protein, partial [Enterocloster clostridioformis]
FFIREHSTASLSQNYYSLTKTILQLQIAHIFAVLAILIEQNRCAMACRGCGAVFSVKKAVAAKS